MTRQESYESETRKFNALLTTVLSVSHRDLHAKQTPYRVKYISDEISVAVDFDAFRSIY
jgi:hypothetical protein